MVLAQKSHFSVSKIKAILIVVTVSIVILKCPVASGFDIGSTIIRKFHNRVIRFRNTDFCVCL